MRKIFDLTRKIFLFIQIIGAYGLNKSLKKDYPRYGEIINKKNPTPIILVGCNTDNIAKDLSKMHKFLTVVGSNGFCKGKLTEHKTSAYIEGVSTNPEFNLNDRGWKFYKNGKLVMYEPSKYFSDINIFR